MAEQDRNRQHQAQPVLVFVSPQSLRQDPESAPRRQAPDWIGEILGEEPHPERMDRYARAGVRYFLPPCWQLFGVWPGGTPFLR